MWINIHNPFYNSIYCLIHLYSYFTSNKFIEQKFSKLISNLEKFKDILSCYIFSKPNGRKYKELHLAIGDYIFKNFYYLYENYLQLITQILIIFAYKYRSGFFLLTGTQIISILLYSFIIIIIIIITIHVTTRL